MESSRKNRRISSIRRNELPHHRSKSLHLSTKLHKLERLQLNHSILNRRRHTTRHRRNINRRKHSIRHRRSLVGNRLDGNEHKTYHFPNNNTPPPKSNHTNKPQSKHRYPKNQSPKNR